MKTANSSPYKGSGQITREQFAFYEMRTTARLMCEGLNDEEIKERIIEENLFQYPIELNSHPRRNQYKWNSDEGRKPRGFSAGVIGFRGEKSIAAANIICGFFDGPAGVDERISADSVSERGGCCV